ncbi:hypothetical protein [Cellulomonas endophytica]|uniref:hypothetical protein n=1 Tax=Cellulomonas endophytica TaxID=2494735 RepID=UPI00101202B7|nr:hypothetical protein [Cellulomonas endophytica]
MRTFLLTHNPQRWRMPADEWAALVARTGASERVPGSWSTGGRRDMDPGDRVFLLRQGPQPRGIVASGWTTGTVERRELFSGAGVRNNVPLEWERVLDLDDPLPTELLRREVPLVPWHALLGSGVQAAPAACERLEELWERHLDEGRPAT